ncbi:hypothetical protein BOX15_Mlig026908g1, partial [Macrostomum lignano]
PAIFAYKRQLLLLAEAAAGAGDRLGPGLLQQSRGYFAWLVGVWNKVDRDRIKQVGPDHACAEWLLRNGASVVWADDRGATSDYNQLGGVPPDQRIQEILADTASLSSAGFPHLLGLSRLSSMRLKNCPYLDDSAFTYLADHCRLERLFVSQCPQVTPKGVLEMARIEGLRHLRLGQMASLGASDWARLSEQLVSKLPKCQLEFETGG